MVLIMSPSELPPNILLNLFVQCFGIDCHKFGEGTTHLFDGDDDLSETRLLGVSLVTTSRRPSSDRRSVYEQLEYDYICNRC